MILETYDKELHDKTLRREGYEDGYNKGTAEGYLEGITAGISTLISTLQEMHLSREETLSKIKEKFDLSHEDAEACIQKYWKE